MYIKSSSFKPIALLILFCFSCSILLPTFTPKQEADACTRIFWSILENVAGSAGWDIIKEAQKKIVGHKDGVDESKSHDDTSHNIILLPGRQYKCNQCGTTDPIKSNVETNAHKEEYTCGGCNDSVSASTAPGCHSTVYQCHTDKAKHHQIFTCKPCDEKYRGCIGGHDDCGCNDDS